MLCRGNSIPGELVTIWRGLCTHGPRLAKCCDASIFASAAKFHMEPHDVVRSSVARIKDSFWFYFSKLVQSVTI